jgi:hypothetical protein
VFGFWTFWIEGGGREFLIGIERKSGFGLEGWECVSFGLGLRFVVKMGREEGVV